MKFVVGGWSVVQKLAIFASFASTSFLNYVFGLTAGWLLGPSNFGLLAFAQSLLLICGLVLETGVPWSLTRDIARAPAAERGRIVRGGLAANLALAGCLMVAISILFALGPFRAGLEQISILVLVCIALACIAVSTVCRGAAQGAERFWAVAAIQVSEVAGKTVGGLGLVLAGQGVVGALSGFVIGGGLAAALGLWLMRGMLATQRGDGRLRIPGLSSAGPMFGALLAFALLLNLDLLAVKLLTPTEPALAGYYQAGIMLANLPCYLVTSALIPLLFARLARAGGLERTVDVVGQGVRFLLLIAVPLELVLVLLPDLVVGLLFPATFAHTADLLRPIALSRTALLFVALLSAAYQAAGRAGVAARALLSVVVLECFGLVVGVAVWGGLGAAVTALIAGTGALAVLTSAYARSVRCQPGRLGFWRWGQPTPSRTV